MQFTDEWSKFAVSELLNTYPTNSLSWDKLSYIEKSKIKNIHYGLIHNGFKSTIISGNNQFIPFVNNSFIPKSYTLLQDGDLILADASEDRKDVGRPVEMINVDNQKIISGLHTIHARNKTNLLINGFKGFYFQSYAMKKQIYKVANGSKIYGISPSSFNEIFISVPSKEEQQKIVNLLQKIECRIETQIKIIENLYSQRKCIFLQLNNNYHHNKIKINELGPVSIANNLSKDDLVDDGRKCILYGELFTKYDLYTTHAISKTNKTYHIITSSGNDLLFPTSTTVNALSLIKPLALCQKDIILGGDMFSIKLNDTYNAIYISCLINYVYKKQLASKTQGTTIVHLYYENIKNEIIEICDYEIQCKIAEYIKFITSKIETEKELLNKLHLQKAFLLRNLFI